jgi:hypothetical protein
MPSRAFFGLTAREETDRMERLSRLQIRRWAERLSVAVLILAGA